MTFVAWGGAGLNSQSILPPVLAANALSDNALSTMPAPPEVSTVLWNLSSVAERRTMVDGGARAGMDLITGERWTLNADGSKTITRPDGSTYNRKPDGTVSQKLDAPVADNASKTGNSARSNYARSIDAAVDQGATRVWPVPGQGATPRRGDMGDNGRTLSDGRYSPEGAYRTRSDGSGRPHMGVDLPARIGDPIYAAASGTVMSRQDARGYGDLVAIDHGDGTRAVYAHISSRNLQPGDRVEIGDVIGRIGVSGHNMGSHLHLEITRSGHPLFGGGAVRIDPNAWMAQGRPQGN